MDAYHSSVLFWLALILSLGTCHRDNREIITGAINCTFLPVNNSTFVSSIYRYFDEDSSVRVVEYVIRFTGNGTDHWEQKISEDSFQPWRWFRTQGVGSSRLLLLGYYYYGLLKPFMDMDSVEVDLTLQASPEGCLASLQRGDLDILLSDYLLEDFSINEKAVKHPFQYDDEVEICSMYIHDEDGWGHLYYECCGYDDSDHLECRDVYEDDWVWALRAFLITLTILLFLHFPYLIPKGYRTYSYVFNPPQDLSFNLRLTKQPEQFLDTTATVLKPREWQKMERFRRKVLHLPTEMTYTAHVHCAHFKVNLDRLLAPRSQPVSIGRSCFDFLIRCKVRHSDPLESCCRTSICGEHDLNCPPWHAWLRGLRTILLMCILALPAIPLLYAISAENLEYQELVDAIEDRGLARTYNFFPGHTFGRVVSGILAFMYLLNMMILIIDGATDSSIAKMFTAVLEISEKRAALADRIARGQSLIKTSFKPIKKHGLVILPLWIIFLALLPVYGVLLYIFHAPLVKILIHAFKALARRLRLLDEDPDSEVKFCKFCEMFWFLISIVFVFIVFTLGINFLIHVVALIIIKILIDEDLIYYVFPVILLLLFYLRDSFKNVLAKYAEHQRIIIETLRRQSEGELRKHSRQVLDESQNHMLIVHPSGFPNEFEQPHIDVHSDIRTSDDVKGIHLDTSVIPIESLENTNMFVVRYGHVRMKLHQVLLFLSKGEILHTSKSFLYHTFNMDCPGSPGRVEENYIRAAIDFLKIAVFLIFVLLVVMAYGNAYYISPANHIFITLVSGILPLLLKNYVFAKQDPDESVDTSSIRFESQFNQKISSFTESWELEDIVLSKIDLEAVPDQAMSLADYRPEVDRRRPTVLNAIDLVLDISSEQPGDLERPHDAGEDPTASTCCCKRNDAVEMKEIPGQNYSPTEEELAKRPSLWHMWSGASMKGTTKTGVWREKSEQETYNGSDGRGVKATWPRQDLGSTQSVSSSSSSDGETTEAIKTTTATALAPPPRRPLRSSSEFRRFSPHDTPKESVSSMLGYTPTDS